MQDRAEDEMSEKQSSERWIVGTLLIVALLTFFWLCAGICKVA